MINKCAIIPLAVAFFLLQSVNSTCTEDSFAIPSSLVRKSVPLYIRHHGRNIRGVTVNQKALSVEGSGSSIVQKVTADTDSDANAQQNAAMINNQGDSSINQFIHINPSASAQVVDIKQTATTSGGYKNSAHVDQRALSAENEGEVIIDQKSDLKLFGAGDDTILYVDQQGIAEANTGSTQIYQISDVNSVGPGSATFDVMQVAQSSGNVGNTEIQQISDIDAKLFLSNLNNFVVYQQGVSDDNEPHIGILQISKIDLQKLLDTFNITVNQGSLAAELTGPGSLMQISAAYINDLLI